MSCNIHFQVAFDEVILKLRMSVDLDYGHHLTHTKVVEHFFESHQGGENPHLNFIAHMLPLGSRWLQRLRNTSFAVLIFDRQPQPPQTCISST
jgi:hypothetical protein